MNDGELWALIRGELSQLRDEMRRASSAHRYATESMILDGMARQIVDAISRSREQIDARAANTE